jgi:hypothetical protein
VTKKRNQQSVAGFTYRRPNGKLGRQVYATPFAAQHGAAWASDRTETAMYWPRDWQRAYLAGYSIVPVLLTAKRTDRRKFRAPEARPGDTE